ncbi:MAG: ASKHA domain-containing protein [Bacteroidales bacterium]
MIPIVVHQGKKRYTLESEGDVTLLRMLQFHNFELQAPCGGNGTCGNCRVFVKGKGYVTSCLYQVTGPIEIILPEPVEAKVLVAQHEYTIQLPLIPGKSVEFSDKPYGVAIDIGTTSLAFYLVNLKSGFLTGTRAILNPQAKYGADVISRIQFASQEKEGLPKLRNALLGAINEELKQLADFEGIKLNDIVKIIVAGNTTMLHLFLGVNPHSLAQYPFKAAFLDMQTKIGAESGLNCNVAAVIKTLPSVSAFVGSDLLAGLASINPTEKVKTFLLMDIGTNGELALVKNNKIWCCSAAAGPAFEGAKIACGMGAIAGAISSFNNEGYITIGNEKPTGICGSGLIDLVAYLIENGIVDRDGKMENDFIIADSKISGNRSDIYLSPDDIREVQLAKSAIASGVNILLKKAGIGFEEVDQLFLAGGFGNYINIENAVKIGLLPVQLQNKTVALGNSSGTGAVCALKSEKFEEMLIGFAKRCIHVELATDDDFITEFAMNMSF